MNDEGESGLGNACLGGSQVDFKTHTVLVVDHSGSMRKADVPGYNTRTAAVYDYIARDFVQPQLDGLKAADAEAPEAVVTIIEMSTHAKILCREHPIDSALVDLCKQWKSGRARSHGNYLPALEEVGHVLEEHEYDDTRIVVAFLRYLSYHMHQVSSPARHTAMC